MQEDDIKPLCKQKCGCPIKDLAIDPKLKRRINLYTTYRSLTIVNAPETKRIEILKEADLYDDPNLLVQAEIILRRADNLRIEREKQKNGNRSRRK